MCQKLLRYLGTTPSQRGGSTTWKPKAIADCFRLSCQWEHLLQFTL